ncbi:hypothetical protein [Streptomyces variegatus]|uniref:hypothetical protein n=1 Tax=Streptomyces variegatus TaxID=284040 RepID=UPI003C30CE3C
MTTGIPALDAALVWGGAVSVLGTVGTVAWRVGRGVAHFASRAGQFFDDWYGEEGRPGVAPRSGVMVRLASLEDGLDHVRHEVRPNSGESLRDAVDLANERLARLCPDPQPGCGDGQAGCGPPPLPPPEEPPASPAP